MTIARGGGGAATQAGIDYQNRVAAWIAVRILAEQEASSPWDFPSDVTLEFLRCETEQPVDDLLVGSSSAGHVFIQVKHTLNLETSEDSDLASCLDQFVRQFAAYRSTPIGRRPWERPLEAQRDRLVLITSSGSSAPIRQHLPVLLQRSRSLTPDQVFDDIAKNQQERKALHTLGSHLSHSWCNVMGREPEENDLLELFRLMRVVTLDVDAGGSDEHEAKDRLRASVLQEPTQVEQAWNTLIQACAGYASARSGADRATLQRVLVDKGFPLKAPPSYMADIERLRTVSQSTLATLSGLSKIRVGSTEVKINRQSTLALRGAAETASMVVVGDPGAGKSGALHDLVETLHREGRDVILFAVDRLEARSLELLRGEIGLTHNVDEILQNWPGADPAFLVVDALDAARSDASAKTFRDLISKTLRSEGRWRVVASIRKFDLRYNPQLHQLFVGQPPTAFHDPEFPNICHLNVPRLNDDELGQIPAQSQQLAELVDRAEAKLHDLLRVPFNLHLLGELIGTGIAIESLTSIRTQIELLDRYWWERVIRDDAQGDAREWVLKRATEQMVERRSLQVNRADLVNAPAVSPVLSDLLSSQVLTEWQPAPDIKPDRSMLLFAHHILFDYAAARLLLRGIPQDFIHRLTSDAELVLVIRPSLVFHFQHLWSQNPSRGSFWDLTLRVVQAQTIPEVGKLIGLGVAADLATQLADFESLFVALEDAVSPTYEAAEQALRHVVGAVLAAPSDPARPLVGIGAGPWCELLERAARSMRLPVAYTVRSLLATLCEQPDMLTPPQKDASGKAARRLLEFAWQQQPRDNGLVIQALRAVCRTFASDTTASAVLLRQCLEPEHLANYGYEELPWLAWEVERLIALDAELVEDLYRAAFTYPYRESQKTETRIGQSNILPLISDSHQDYENALYALADAYPAFLRRDPIRAIHTLIAVLDGYVAHQHPQTSNDSVEEHFDFDGKEARIRTDYSVIWDSGEPYHDDEPLKMLNAFEEYMRQLSNDAEQTAERRKLLNVIVAENRLAILWKRLLASGTHAPEILGREIRCLAWALPILTGDDTTTEAGHFLNAVFGALDAADRERIEHTILILPETVEQNRRETGERTRNRLLGCLPPEGMVTEEAKQLRRTLEIEGRVPHNEPPFRVRSWVGDPYGEAAYLADEGVPVEAESNRRIQELERPVKEFTKKYPNAPPPAEEVKAVLPALYALRDALVTAQADGVHQKQSDYAWACLTEACEQISRAEELSCETEEGSFAREVLLEAANHPDPVHRPEYDAQFDEGPSWGSPAVRVEAAMGLTWIARYPSCADKNVLDAIERLSHDPVPAVRYQVATCLLAHYQTTPDFMWNMLECLCREEPSRGVLQGLLARPLRRLAGFHADRVTNLVKIIFDRITEGAGAKRVRKFCISIFTGLYLWQGNQACRDIVCTIADHSDTFADEALHIIAGLRDQLMQGAVEPSEPQQDEVRRRAFELMNRVLRSVVDTFRALQHSHEGTQGRAWTEEERERLRRLARLADAVGMELYFGSGAYNAKNSGEDTTSSTPGRRERQRFLHEAEAILDDLADLGFPSLVHHLLETLDFLAVVDPEKVFLRVGRIVRAGKTYGYQYELLAADLIVRLVERYLAEYRFILRENPECQRVLLEILDTFVHWPSARRLTYHLEDIWR